MEHSAQTALSDRQRREIEYHRRRALEQRDAMMTPVSLKVAGNEPHRWWNAYWVIFRKAKRLGLANRRVLVVGCGFGQDAIQLGSLGALVCAVDISEESVDIARQRAKASGGKIEFEVSAAERLPYGDGIFDLVYLPDVVHHLDVPSAMREVRRVLSPSGIVLGNEPYTHSWVQAVRDSRFVRTFLYPRMVKLVYGRANPYITDDEHKLDQHNLAEIGECLLITEKKYFLLLSGRVLPLQATFLAKMDRLILMIPFLGFFLGGRVVFTARRAPAISG